MFNVNFHASPAATNMRCTWTMRIIHSFVRSLKKPDE